MIHLYFSLSSPFLFLALWKDSECLIKVQKRNFRQHSENFLTNLQQSLNQINHNLKDISEIYFTSQPSGQTGIRVALSFLATLQVVNPWIKIYHIDTLLLQSGTENCISLLTIDSQGNKFHLAVYQNKKCLLKNKIINKKELSEVEEKFSDFVILKDCSEIDFFTNFQKLQNYFIPLKKIETINC
ncbi:MAG: tRNA N6-adenosine threonylcarbamoyltransferase, mitochondrial [Mycoplasmataceae bacterium]|nr:MAG: tRNA N6-adenosine threonylcarbamoyltransferase, mitochondrial [Mycoplasmataceae bacterium]